MRPTLTLLLFLAVVCSLLQAQVSWSKKTYSVVGGAIDHADFNNDGYPDLFISTGTSSVVLLNNGDGTFNTTKTFASNAVGNHAFLDFNHDGNIDVAGCDGNGNFIVLLGHGDGTLTESLSVADGCSWVAVSDFNKDGNPDIAVGVPSPAEDSTGNQVIVYLGDGQGGIASEVINSNVDFIGDFGIPCLLNGSGYAADFDGDKVADIAFSASCLTGVIPDSVFIVGKGDGAGHFTFHRDIDFGWNAPTNLRATDFNQDGRVDLYAVMEQDFPFANAGFGVGIFSSNGDGTFTFNTPFTTNIDTGRGTSITSAALADIDGDGINDITVALNFNPADEDPNVQSFVIFKGKPDGTYTPIGQSPLAKPMGDMIWADFNKDARPDLAVVRGDSTDVWLNTTVSSPSCPPGGLRMLNFCSTPSAPGVFHFISTTLDNRPVNAMQIYVDGVVKFLTPEDMLNFNLPIPDGTHRITVKAWDDVGPFSSTANVLSCPNTTNRTVRICSPVDGTTIAASHSTGIVHIVASAATNLKFSAFQIYIDGQLKIEDDAHKFFDLSLGAISVGSHRVTVKGWDTNGAFFSTVTINVQ